MARELDIEIKVTGAEEGQRKLAGLDQSINKVGSTAKTTAGTLDQVDNELKSLGGTVDTAIGRAQSYAQKIMQIGGATKLTADEQKKATEVLKAGIAEYERLGNRVPGFIRAVSVELAGLQTATAAVTTETVAMGEAQAVATGSTSKLMGLTGLLEGAMLASGAALAAAVPFAVSYANSLDKVAGASGAGYDGAQRLENIAVKTGVAVHGLASEAGELARRIAEGKESTVGALDQLHLKTSDLINLRADDKFIAVASALGQVADEGERAALAKDLFSNWQEVMPALTVSVSEFADAHHRLTEQQIEDLVKVQRAWDDLVLDVKRSITEIVTLAATPIEFIIRFVFPTRPDLDKMLQDHLSSGTHGGKGIELETDLANLAPKSPGGFAPPTTTHPEMGLGGKMVDVSNLDPSLISSTLIGGRTLEDQREANAESLSELARTKKLIAEIPQALIDLQDETDRVMQGILMGVNGFDLSRMAASNVAGLLQAGNIDLFHRPHVMNEDGSISTVRSMSFEEEGRNILVPTVVGNEIFSNADAMAEYHRTGRSFGIFDTSDHADAYAQALHEQQAGMLAGTSRLAGPGAIGITRDGGVSHTGIPTLNGGTSFTANPNGGAFAGLGTGPTSIVQAARDNIAAASGRGIADSLASAVPAAIEAAIQGGGSKLQAAGSAVGSVLFGKDAPITKSIAGLFSANGFLGKTLSSAVPIIGSLIGPAIEGLGKLWGKVFGTAGRDAVRDFAAGMGGFDEVHTKLNALGADGETLWKQLTQGVGRNNATEAKASIEAVTKALNAFEHALADANSTLKVTTDKLTHITSITPAVRDGLAAALNAKTPQDYAAALTAVNGLLDAQAQKHQHLKELAEKYGLSLQDMGKDFAQGEIDTRAQSIMQDFTDLTEAGAHADAVLKGMAGSYSQLVQDAKASGTELPNAMKPTLQKLLDMGDLVDKDGKKLTSLDGLNFGDTLTDRLNDIKGVILDLQGAIDNLAAAFRGLPTSLPSLPSAATRGQVNTSGVSGSPDAGGFNPDDPYSYQYSHTGAIIRAAGLERFHSGGALLRKVGWQSLSAQLGLASDERVIIGQTNEGVLNRGAMRQMTPQQFHALNRGAAPAQVFGGSHTVVHGDTVHVAITATGVHDADDFVEQMKRPGGGVDIVIEQIAAKKRGRDVKLKRALR